MISWQDTHCMDENKHISKTSLHAYSGELRRMQLGSISGSVSDITV